MNGGTEAELRGTRHTLVTVWKVCCASRIRSFRSSPKPSGACESTLRYHCRHHHAAAVPEYDASQVDEAALADTEWLKQRSLPYVTSVQK